MKIAIPFIAITWLKVDCNVMIHALNAAFSHVSSGCSVSTESVVRIVCDYFISESKKHAASSPL